MTTSAWDARDKSGLAHALSVSALVMLVAFLPVSRGIEFILAPVTSFTLYARLHIGLIELLFVAGVLADPAVKRPRFADLPGWAKGFGLVWLLWSTLSMLAAEHLGAAVIRQAEWLLHATAAACLWAFLGAYPRWRDWLPRALVIGFLTYAVLITFFLKNVGNPDHFAWMQAMLGFRNIRHFSAYAAMAVLAGLAPLFSAERPLRQELLRTAAVVTIAWAFLFWSGGRGAFLAIAAALIAASAVKLLPRPAAAWTLILATAFAGLLISIPFTPPNANFGFIRLAGDLVSADTAQQFSSGRLQLWGQALELIGNHTLLGLGPDNYALYPRGANQLFEHPHNAFLQAALDWGVPGAIMALAMGLMSLLEAAKHALACRQAPAVTGLVLALMLAALSMVSSTLYYGFPTLICGFALVLALPPQGEGRGV